MKSPEYQFPWARDNNTRTMHLLRNTLAPRKSLSLRTLSFIGLFLLLFPLCVSSSQALTSDELLIVANKAVPEGLSLAHHYIRKRNVPVANLLLVDTPDKEQISRQNYDQQIARPVREFLEKNDPDGRHFRCIVLMYGIPLRVSPPPLTEMENRRLQELKTLLKENTEREYRIREGQKGEKKEGGDKWTELKRDIRRLARADWGASVDSELALVMEKNFELDGWKLNRYFVGFRGKEIKNMPQRPILVSRLDGPTPLIVRRIIDDSSQAETEGLSGKAYFDARWPEKILIKKGTGPSDYQRYDRAIHNAARIVRESKKLPVVVDSREVLFGAGDAPDAALYCGWYSLGKYIDAFTWARGAVGYHVASSECTTLKEPGSTVWCKVMLEKGVAATVGPVAEPYLQSFPVPEIFFGCLLDGHLTLAECYGIANPFWSWQQVLIGDPLYRPFKKQ